VIYVTRRQIPGGAATQDEIAGSMPREPKVLGLAGRPAAQAAKTALLAAGSEGEVSKKSPPGRSYAQVQAAKTTLFAAGNEVRA
jgi:hypothetical protein